jgi:hypothetical protein
MGRKTNRELEEEVAALQDQVNAVADVLEDDELKEKDKLAEIEGMLFDDDEEEDEEEDEDK